MTGIFGYFCKNIREKKEIDILDIFKNDNYSLKEISVNKLGILSSLDIKTTEPKVTIKNLVDKICIISCGEIYDDKISNPEKTILSLYMKGKLNFLKDIKKLGKLKTA